MGILRRAPDTWRRIHGRLRGKARLLPSTPELAVTTLAGLSPLAAGLVDSSAPVPFAIINVDTADVGLVAGVHLTSAAELTAFAVNGADAQFSAELDAVHGVTRLAPKGAPSSVTVGVAGDYLVFATSTEHFREGAGYVAGGVRPSSLGGEALELVVERPQLAGALEPLVHHYGDRARVQMLAADADNRARHGGRPPDFGNPNAVVIGAVALTNAIAHFVSGTSKATLRSSLLEPTPTVRIEIEPLDSGPVRDLSNALPHGSVALLLGLPTWADVVLHWQRQPEESTSSPFVDRVSAILGGRLTASDRTRLERWAEDVDRGLGRTASIGTYGEGNQRGGFVVSLDGDGRALRRAVSGLADVLRVPAIRAPLEAFVGKITMRTKTGSIAKLPATRMSMAITPGGGEAFEYEVACAAEAHRAALVFGTGGIDPRVEALVRGAAERALGADVVLSEFAKRIGSAATYTAVGRFQASENGASLSAAAALGSDQRIIWTEMEADIPVFEALLAGGDSSRP